MHLPVRGSKKGFTLLELIVVIVILGILAAIAIPTFNLVIKRSQDSSTNQTLLSLDREARALAGFDNRTVTEQDYRDAAADLKVAAGAGVYAADVTVVTNSAAVTTTSQVGVQVSGNKAGVSMLSKSGACILLQSEGTAVGTFKRNAGTCAGSEAIAGSKPGDTVVQGAPAAAPLVPSAPVNVVATAGALSASVAFTAPAPNGPAITSYTVTASPGGATATGTTSPITVSGLTGGTAYTFTVTATNANGTGPASAASNSATPTPALYAFSSHTFTPAGATGANGPSLSQVQSAYSASAWTQNTANLTTSNGIQLWTVPMTGSYRMVVAGAKGGGSRGGLGAVVEGNVQLTQGQVVKILVGQQGAISYGNGNAGTAGGGGGGSFVALNSTPVAVAGGGGGGAGDYNSTSYATSSGNNANATVQVGNTSVGGFQNLNNAGQGGPAAPSDGPASGGGGFSGNGVSSAEGSSGGLSFINGGTGGVGGGSFTNAVAGVGGFGGGGGAWNNSLVRGGGGGGYSGGQGASWSGSTPSGAGGGGGSYTTGLGSVATSASNNGTGYVTITFVG